MPLAVLILGAGAFGLWATICKLVPALRRTPSAAGQPVRRFDLSDDAYSSVLTQIDQLRSTGQRTGTVTVTGRDIHHDEAILLKVIDRIHSRGVHVTATEPLSDGWQLTVTLA